MRKPTSLLAHATVTVSLLAAASGLGATPLYRITQIGALPGDSTSVALAMNDLGQVVGSSGVPGQDGDAHLRRGFVWSAQQGMQAIGPINGLHNALAEGINNSGTVVAHGYNFNNNATTASEGFLWTPTTGATALPKLPGWGRYGAYGGINAAGWMAGYFQDSQGRNQAVLWDPQGQISALPSTGYGNASTAAAINQAGQVLVYAYGGLDYLSFRWDPATGYQALATPAGFSWALGRGMNGLGQAAGFASNNFSSGTGAHAVLWASDGSVTDLGLSASLRMSSAADVNDAGLVVGHAVQASNNQTVGFLWTQGGGMQTLESLLDPQDPLWGQVSAIVPQDINNVSQIAGQAMFNGVRYAFVMTPVPEPGTGALLLAGVLALGWRRRRGFRIAPNALGQTPP